MSDRESSIFISIALILTRMIIEKNQTDFDRGNFTYINYDDQVLILPSGEYVTDGIFDVDDVKRSWMTLPTHNNSNSSQVTTSRNHTQVTCEFCKQIKSLQNIVTRVNY